MAVMMLSAAATPLVGGAEPLAPAAPAEDWASSLVREASGAAHLGQPYAALVRAHVGEAPPLVGLPVATGLVEAFRVAEALLPASEMGPLAGMSDDALALALAAVPPESVAGLVALLPAVAGLAALVAEHGAGSLRVAGGVVALLDRIEALRAMVPAAPPDLVGLPVDAVGACTPALVLGPVAVGSHGKDCFGGNGAGPVLLSYDPGGDDTYHDPAIADGWYRLVAVAVELGGDDRYFGRTAFARDGVALLADMAGDDRYLSSWEWSQAVALDEGQALLIDEDGSDVYSCSWLAMCQGWGSGDGSRALLWDRRGDDSYSFGGHSAWVGGLGYAWFGAAALALDSAGDDQYRAPWGQGLGSGAGIETPTRGAFMDEGGDDAHRFCHCGTAFGDASAMFLDLGGADTYEAHGGAFENDSTWGDGWHGEHLERGIDCEREQDPDACDPTAARR